MPNKIAPSIHKKIKDSKFSDQAYILHMQLHLNYIKEYSEDMTCPFCIKYPIPNALFYEQEEESEE